MQMLVPMQARMEIGSQNDTSTQHEEMLNSQRDRQESIVVITDDAQMMPQLTVAAKINSKPIIRAI